MIQKISFTNGREPLFIEADSLKEAVEKAVKDGVSLAYADLYEADLRCANLRSGKLWRTNMRRVNLQKANLYEVDLWEANLCEADMREADLQGAGMCGVNLMDAKLHEADLSRAFLCSAELRGTDIWAANLKETNLEGVNIDYSCLPLQCGSLEAKFDKRLAVQLLYHACRALQSVDDDECKKFLELPEVKALANQFHRAGECGKI